MKLAYQNTASFLEPMLLLSTNSLPDSPGWLYELKLDGYRAIGFKSGDKAQLRSRNNKDFTVRYGAITETLKMLPNETVVDGEVVALDEAGSPRNKAEMEAGEQSSVATGGETYQVRSGASVRVG